MNTFTQRNKLVAEIQAALESLAREDGTAVCDNATSDEAILLAAEAAANVILAYSYGFSDAEDN